MRNLNRTSLLGLRAIEAAGRLGSLRAAAEEIGVTMGAVSQQIQKTEQQLGRSLFERLPKGLVPNALGEEVIARLTGGMAELSAAVALAEQGRDDRLTVSVAPVFAGKWLVWRLTDFHQRHPGIRIRVDATDALVNPDGADVDLCIRVGAGPYGDLRSEHLCDQRVFPVCSPRLAEGLGTLHDLGSVPIIRDAGEMSGWEAWLAPNGLDPSMLGDGPEFSDGSLCLDAAIAGQGVFMAWETLAADALRMGQVVAPFTGRHGTGLAYWLITGRHRKKTQAVRAFETWLRSELQATLEAL